MEHKAAWKPLTKALKSKGVRNERRKRKGLWLHFTCQWHAAGALLCVPIWLCVSVCLCVFTKLSVCVCVYIYVRVVCAHPLVCYAWRHTCSNRVVVGSDSCPVPFTAQSSQPLLCSVRLLMRINVLWRPLGLPHSPPNSTANEEIQPCQNTEVERERNRRRKSERQHERGGNGATINKLGMQKKINKKRTRGVILGAVGLKRGQHTVLRCAWDGHLSDRRRGNSTQSEGSRLKFWLWPKHVSWMAIPCPRAATGDDCPASPQGSPLTPQPAHTNTYAHLPCLETWRWMNSMDDRIHDPKIATVWPATRRKTHAVKADHHKISAMESESLLTNVKQIDTNTHTRTPGALSIWRPSVTVGSGCPLSMVCIGGNCDEYSDELERQALFSPHHFLLIFFLLYAMCTALIFWSKGHKNVPLFL